VLRGNYRESLCVGWQAATAAQQKEMLDGTNENFRALGLTDSYEAILKSFFLT